MKKFNGKLIEFIEKSTCSFTCIKTIKGMLEGKGYVSLKEDDKWNLTTGKYYLTRNDASIIVFEIPFLKVDAFPIVMTHSDTPSLLLKPNGIYTKEKYLKHNAMPYELASTFVFLAGDDSSYLTGQVIHNNGGQVMG